MKRQIPLMWRMSLPTLVVSVLLLAFGLVAGAYIYQLNAHLSDELDRWVDAVLSSEELVFALRDTRNEMTLHARGTPEALEAAQASFAEAAHLLQTIKEHPHDRQLLEVVQQRMATIENLLSNAGEMGREEFEAGMAVLRGPAVDAAGDLLNANQGTLEAISSENVLFARRVGTGLAFLGLCGSAAGLIAGLGVSRSVVRSIETLGGSVQSLSESLTEGASPAQPTSELQELIDVMSEVQVKTEGMVTELQRSRETAARADQLSAVGQLASGIAHELRNPLTAIKLLADNSAEQGEPMNAAEVAMIREEAARMEQMLQTFLDFARPPRLVRGRVDAVAEVLQAVDIVRPRAERVGVTIEHQVDGAVELLADRQQLRQVLLNLMINAIDAQPGGGEVLVTIGPAADGEAVIEVADRGAGIDPEIEPRLFEPFVSTKDTGIGLGLAVSQRIVASHGGRIAAENRPDGGAAFSVQLPIYDRSTPLKPTV
ncbi:ATP-binding protein [Botrimarina mediterranea]|uniref:sensor histidine kinase n=1 Tax=Botrimarina mediterranea TaxID=2528022 RepID=UPI00119D0323